MKRKGLPEQILEGLWEAGSAVLFLLPRPFETKSAWARRLRNADPNSYYHAVRRLRNKGYLEILEKNNKKFIQLTEAGELQMLIRKAGVNPSEKWDGKWRLFMFDIPEKSKEKRILIRALLKKNNFVKIQNSVYITPFSLNREAIEYLKQIQLMDFIRIMRVDEVDDDKRLKNRFGLT